MMTDQNETTTKFPTHTVYFVKQNENTGKSEWIKAGVAWEHNDNEGLNLSLDSLGQRVSLTVRKNKER